MKKDINFWLSLEEYSRKVVNRTPIPYSWIVSIIILASIVTSIITARVSMVSVDSTQKAAAKAAELGDYDTAKELYNYLKSTTNSEAVLGAQTELSYIIFPEIVVQEKIDELELKLSEYPGNREIFIELSNLYSQLGNSEKTVEYREKARVLDPNNISY